jgi:NADH-quinone oxidoreductase subunit N
VSAPVLWIFLPALISAVLFAFKDQNRLTSIVGAITAIMLGGLAWKMPPAEMISLGPLSINFSASLVVMGRQLVLETSTRPILAMIYLMAAFWFGGAYTARVSSYFVPLGLSIVTLLTAALAVKPFLYAALFIQIAAFISVPLLSSPGKPVGRGVLRFLSFQTVGTPFILFTGWLITGTEAIPGDINLIFRTLIPLGLGFSFLLAVFPFHTWVPMLAQESHPYAAAFIFFLLPGIVSLFGLSFFESYAWMRNTPMIFTVLRLAGILMVASGGILAAFQTHLGRMLGYAVTVDIGLSLLAIGIHRGINIGTSSFSPSLAIFFALFISRGLALGIWALGISAIGERSSSLHFRDVQGQGRKLPIAAIGIILAHFSLAGFPLLMGFPPRLALLGELGRISPLLTFWTLVGSLGLLGGGLRTLAVLVMGPEDEPWKIYEKLPQVILLILGILTLFLAGLYPLV